MPSSFVDLVKINITNSGTGALTLGAAVEGYRGTEVLINGESYGYSIQQDSAWEYGRATYLSSSHQLVRSPIASSDGGTPIAIRAGGEVAFVALAEDLTTAVEGQSASQAYVDAAVATIEASRGNWVNVVDQGAAGEGAVYDTQLANAITLARGLGVGVWFPNGAYTFNALHDFEAVPFAGESEGGVAIHTTLNGTLFKITIDASVEDIHYRGLSFYCDIGTGDPYDDTAAIEVSGDASGFIQYGSIRGITTFGFHTGIKITKATRTTGFGDESNFDWFSLTGLTFNGGLNPGKYGVQFTAGSGTGTTIGDVKGSLGAGDATSAYFRYEGSCVVGDIVVEGHFGGARSVISVAPEVASYLSNVTIRGQIDADTTTPVTIGNSAVPLSYLNLTGCNLGGNVDVAGGIASFLKNSVIFDQQTGLWLAGKSQGYASGANAIPLFGVDLAQYVGTTIELVIQCLIGGTGVANLAQRYFVTRNDVAPILTLIDSDYVPASGSPFQGSSVSVTTTASGTRATFTAEFTASADGTIEAQIKAVGGVLKVSRLSGSAPGGRVFATPINRLIWLDQYKFESDVGFDSAMTRAAAHIAAIGGGELLLPRGTIDLNSPFVYTGNGLHIRGLIGVSTFVCHFAAGDIITFGDGAANPNNCSITGVSFNASLAKTSGAAIKFKNGHSLRADKVRMDGNMYWGFDLEGGAGQYGYAVEDFEINSGLNAIVVGADGSLVQDVYTGGKGAIAGTTDAAILLKHGSGLYFNQGTIDIISCAKGVVTYPDSGKNILAAWFANVLADTITGNGWDIITNGGQVRGVDISSCWGSSCGGDGFHIDQGSGAISDVSLSIPKAHYNAFHGIRALACKKLAIGMPDVSCNSMATTTTYDGIYIAPAVDGVTIKNGHSGADGPVAVTNQQRYGVNLAAGTGANAEVDGIDCRGNVTAALNNGFTGTGNRIHGVKGFKTAAQGAAQISSGATTVTVTHGLGATPAQTDILTVPTVNLGSVGVAGWWVDTVTSTTFRINVNAAPSGDIFFAWSARIMGA